MHIWPVNLILYPNFDEDDPGVWGHAPTNPSTEPDYSQRALSIFFFLQKQGAKDVSSPK
jgi:hypothetical protein